MAEEASPEQRSRSQAPHPTHSALVFWDVTGMTSFCIMNFHKADVHEIQRKEKSCTSWFSLFTAGSQDPTLVRQA